MKDIMIRLLVFTFIISLNTMAHVYGQPVIYNSIKKISSLQPIATQQNIGQFNGYIMVDDETMGDYSEIAVLDNEHIKVLMYESHKAFNSSKNPYSKIGIFGKEFILKSEDGEFYDGIIAAHTESYLISINGNELLFLISPISTYYSVINCFNITEPDKIYYYSFGSWFWDIKYSVGRLKDIDGLVFYKISRDENTPMFNYDNTVTLYSMYFDKKKFIIKALPEKIYFNWDKWKFDEIDIYSKQ